MSTPEIEAGIYIFAGIVCAFMVYDVCLTRYLNRKIHYGKLRFSPGQKVKCFVTHEVPKSFVGVGTVVGFSHNQKSYWSGA